jgi:uncharacterized protein involved in exopolysaccharide biosynthesis
MEYDPVIEAYQAAGSEITLVSIGNVLLRHRWLLILSMVIGYLVFAFDSYVPYHTYTANTTFTPRSRSQQSMANNVLSQLGLSGGSSGSGGAYYMEVIRSPRILAPVAEARYSFKTDTGTISGTLIDIYGMHGAEPRAARARMVGMLNTAMKTSTQMGGMMKLSVTTPYAELSAMVARRILSELNAFNLGTRQEQASAERQFIEARVAEAKIALSQAENAQQVFVNENQFYREASPLALEWDRLHRDVELRQELYTGLAKLLDQARIEEVRDNPVLTVIEPADPPLGADPVQWPRKAILGALIGLFLGTVIAFLHAYLARTRENYSDEYTELTRLKAETAEDLRKPWKPLARILATGRP